MSLNRKKKKRLNVLECVMSNNEISSNSLLCKVISMGKMGYILHNFNR